MAAPLTGTFVTYTASYDQHVDPIGDWALLVLQDTGESTLTNHECFRYLFLPAQCHPRILDSPGTAGTYAQKRVIGIN